MKSVLLKVAEMKIIYAWKIYELLKEIKFF